MSIESKLDKLTAAVVALTGVLANAALGAPVSEKTVKEEVQVKAPAMAESAAENVVADTASAGVGGGKYANAANSSVDEIRARLRPVVEKHGPASIEAALKTLGVDMLTNLSAEQYPALLEGIANAIGVEV